MLIEMERTARNIFVRSDEKMFTVEAVTNKQIDSVYARMSRDLLVTTEVISDVSKLFALWFGLLLRQLGGKSPFVFIDESVKVNSQVYSNMLQAKSFSLPHRNF